MDRAGKVDLLIFGAVIGLLSIGLIMVFSASSSLGLGEEGNPFHFVRMQASWAALGLAGMLFFSLMDYRKLRYVILPGIIVSLVLLFLVLIIGTEISGSQRWIVLGGLRMQPSEFSKLALVLFSAMYIANKGIKLRLFFTGLLPLLVVLGLHVGLNMLEPDFGTAVALTAVVGIMIFAGGAHLLHLLFLATAAIPGALYLIVHAPYRLQRLMAFLDPWADPTDTGWSVIQSLLAIGSGGLFGVGLGGSRQKFFYLPEHHTDFIFAILAEELGLLGGMFVIGCFFVIVWRGLRLAVRTSDAFGSMLAVGISAMIGFQAFLNIGVVTGSLPVTGITLPLISYGGSSLVVSLSSIGILLNISRQVE